MPLLIELQTALKLEVFDLSKTAVNQELIRRQTMWNELVAQDTASEAKPTTLRALGIYGGAQGIWVDKAQTSNVTEDGNGVAIGLLHTGRHYPDDFADDGVLYHYPHTHRPESRDTGEIEATKNTQRFGLPVFVIRYAPHGKRNVRIGWVIDWDDSARQFLITFSDKLPPTDVKPSDHVLVDDAPFVPIEVKKRTPRQLLVREGQHHFRFYVVKRYGARCAVCDVDIIDLLQATHIIAKDQDGTDDPRNGLLLCANHRLAFDAGLFGIEPSSLQLKYRSSGPSAIELRITRASLGHLANRPHKDALNWHFTRWFDDTSEEKQADS